MVAERGSFKHKVSEMISNIEGWFGQSALGRGC